MGCLRCALHHRPNPIHHSATAAWHSAGNAIQGLLSGRVYVAKLFGTAAARLAGLALGIEGPMIHLGACVASLVCHAEHRVYRWANLHRGAGQGPLARMAAQGMAPDMASEEFIFKVGPACL